MICNLSILQLAQGSQKQISIGQCGSVNSDSELYIMYVMLLVSHYRACIIPRGFRSFPAYISSVCSCHNQLLPRTTRVITVRQSPYRVAVARRFYKEGGAR